MRQWPFLSAIEMRIIYRALNEESVSSGRAAQLTYCFTDLLSILSIRCLAQVLLQFIGGPPTLFLFLIDSTQFEMYHCELLVAQLIGLLETVLGIAQGAVSIGRCIL